MAEQTSRKSALVSWMSFQVIAIIVTLAACRVLHPETYLCALLFSIYICLMARYAYPKQKSEPKNAPTFTQGKKIFRVYIRLAAYVGLYFPFAYVILGLAAGGDHTPSVVRTAAPHTFLLACQVLSERISYASAALSPPSVALVPILYNSGRLVSIWAWLQTDFSTPTSSPAARWVLCGRALGIANLILWTYNLFGFLLPMYLPFCFRRYFEYEKA